MILIFESTTAALNAESLLEQWGLDVEPVPVPEGSTSQCGPALDVNTDDTGQAVKALTVAGLVTVIPAAGHAAV